MVDLLVRDPSFYSLELFGFSYCAPIVFFVYECF